MSCDILNHQPALPSTTLPGSWLIDLPHDPVIHVRRYHVADISEASSGSKEDPLEKAWRSINSLGASGVRSIFGDDGACAVICASDELKGIEGAKSRELWVFQANSADQQWDGPPLDTDSGSMQGECLPRAVNTSETGANVHDSCIAGSVPYRTLPNLDMSSTRA